MGKQGVEMNELFWWLHNMGYQIFEAESKKRIKSEEEFNFASHFDIFCQYRSKERSIEN